MINYKNDDIDQIINKKFDYQYSKNTISIEGKGYSLGNIYNQTFSFKDNAQGISIETLFSKMLVPSISTKTLETFTSKEITESDNTGIYICNSKSSRHGYYFTICVGDVGIYTTDIIHIEKNVYSVNFIFCLGLPAQTPMPVSRDDVILTDPIFYNFAKQEFYKLIDIIIQRKTHLHSIYILFLLFKKYAEYSKDVLIYQLIEEGYDYISKKNDVVLIPFGQGNYYNDYIQPYFKDISFLESNRVNYESVRKLVLSKLKIIKSPSIGNRILLLVKNQSEVYADGGLFDILFLNEDFVKSKDWEQKLKLQMKIQTFKDGFNNLPQNMIQNFLNFKYKYMLTGPLTNKNLTKTDYDSSLKIIQNFGEFDKNYNLYKKGKYSPSPIIQKTSDILYPYVQKFYDIISPNYTPHGDQIIDVGGYILTDIFNYLFYSISQFYVLSGMDGYLVDKFTNILYTFLMNFPYRKIEIMSSEESHFYLYLYLFNISIYNYWSDYDLLAINYVNYMSDDKTIYKLDTLKQKESFMNYINFFYHQILESKNSNYIIKNPLWFFFMQRTSYIEQKLTQEDYKVRDDIGLFNKDFILDKHYIYWLYLDAFFIKYFQKNPNISLHKFKKCMEFIYQELQNKYSFEYLELYVSEFLRYINNGATVFDIVVQELLSIANIYDSIITEEIYQYKIRDVQSLQSNISFDAIQLLNYVYEHEVSMSNIDWFQSVGSFIPSHNAKFQALEIVINEGTSKSFANSVLTEMIQNSIDAIRNKSIDQSYKENAEIKIECGEIINLGNKKGLSVTDYIGIPTRGIISILVPFLSTKTSKEELSTGEMGTGFMNVYRQPYTQKVIIQTRNPTDNFIYKIEAIPILSQNKKRVINIQYNISKTSEKYDESKRYTCITILFNDKLKDNEISSLFTDVELYSNRVLPIIAPSINLNRHYNQHSFMPQFKLLYEDSNIGKIYSTERKLPSYILTNGVPFGDLAYYINNMNNRGFWVLNYGLTQIIADLNKSAYIPTQTRKRIKLPPEIENKFDNFILNGIFEHIIENVPPADLNMIGHIQGSGFEGDPKQFKPNKNGIEFLQFTSKKLGFSFASMINHIIDIIYANPPASVNDGDPFSRIIYEKNKEKEIVPHRYYEIIMIWFGNKIYIKEDVSKTANKIQIKEDQVPSFVLDFIENMVTQLWKCAQRLVNQDLIRGLTKTHINRKPMKIKYGVSEHVDGYYNSDTHEIFLKLNKIVEAKQLHKGIEDILREKNVAKIINTLKFSQDFIDFMGTSNPQPPVFVHELCHAFLGNGCQGENVHGDFTIYVRATNTSDFGKKTYSFYQGANELFLLFLQDYKPYWL
jgi:hypothetical protein